MKSEHDFLEPDPNHLDEEWVRQPKQVEKYAIRLAEARKDAAEAKAALALCEAELSLGIRNDPEAYGLKGKPTIDAVASSTLCQPEYKKAIKAKIEADFQVGLLEAVTEALRHKKAALENLVSLWSQSYFAEPRPLPGSGQAVGDLKSDRAFGKRK